MQAAMRIATDAEKALPKKINFTHASLTALNCPKGKDRLWVYDSKQPGLAFLVTETGSKSFHFLKKVNGNFRRKQIGSFPALHLDHARRTVSEWIGDYSRGIDPIDQLRTNRAQITFGELFEKYMTEWAKVRKRGWKEDEAQFERYLTGWKGRKINSIHHADVVALHARIGRDNGPYTANRLAALLHKVFSTAKGSGLSENPAHGIDKFPETSRERIVGHDEMPRLLAAIADEIEPWNDFFMLALLTGCRRSNIASMRWDETNLTTHTWTIPDAKAKGKRTLVVALVDEALTILRDRLECRKDDNPWVFPSYGKTGHIKEPKMAWKRILERAKITERLTIHDLRRTMGSFQAALGASLPVIGKSLGHRNVATTAIYARLNLDPVRASVAAAAKAMLSVGAKATGKEKGKGRQVKK